MNLTHLTSLASANAVTTVPSPQCRHHSAVTTVPSPQCRHHSAVKRGPHLAARCSLLRTDWRTFGAFVVTKLGLQADDQSAGTPGWVWLILVMLIVVAAVAGGMWFQRRSNQRALNTLFQNGGAKSRSISTSVRPGRAAASAANANANGGDGNGEYSNPAYADPTYGTPSGGNPLPAGAITPVYHVSGGTGGTGTGVASPTYQIPMELAPPDPTYQVPIAPPAAAKEVGETGLGYLEVKAVTNQPMYRVLGRSPGSMGSTRSAVASPQLYDVRDATGTYS